MKQLLLTALAALSAATLAVATPQNAASANNAFGISLFKGTTKRSSVGNKFLSPISAYLALSMVYNGASGGTQAEMEKVLAANGLTVDEFNAQNAALLKSLHSHGDEFKLALANSMWANEGFVLRNEFTDKVRRGYDAKLSVLDFSLPSASVMINEWCSAKTQGKIPSIVGPKLPAELRLIVLNATYFKADWSAQFSAYATQMRPFNVTPSKTVDVPMMGRTGNYRYVKTDNAEVIELPYGRTGSVSMVVALPLVGKTAADLEADLSAAKFKAVMARLMTSAPAYGVFKMPKFKFSYEATLNGALAAMGMPTAFTNAATFDAMTADSVSISQVLQKTFVAVDEKGTEAAAVTGIMVGTTSLPPQPTFNMEVNRPYLFAIRDNQTGAILFLGSIQQPEGATLTKDKDKAPSLD